MQISMAIEKLLCLHFAKATSLIYILLWRQKAECEREAAKNENVYRTGGSAAIRFGFEN